MRHRAFLLSVLIRLFADRPRQTPAQWCCENLVIDEPENHGPFTLEGREYLREMIDDWADPDVTDQVEIMGSQSGKSTAIMGGAAWCIVHHQRRLFWVMPTRDTIMKHSRTRWMPLLRASPGTRELVPEGARRHDFKTLQQQLGQAIVDLVWSNSPAALSSIPAQVVILDELDKFNQGGKSEANAVDLADQRTKNASSPKRIKTTTPTLVEGLGWQEFLKTDQRRRFVPCPGCGKFVVLIWSKEYTVFRVTGRDAVVRWDKEAKRKDGTWDLDRVERSARFECPHCGFHIRDPHKPTMDRAGRWEPTSTSSARGYRGRHLPSLYSPSSECAIGRLAVKFLQQRGSLLSLQGFINGDLAEPYQAQDTLEERVELISEKITVGEEAAKLMTVDCQAKAPFFWYVVRAWGETDTQGIECGHLDTWEEVREKQLEHKIPDVGVIPDSGFGAKSDAEVYRNCVRFCEFIPNRATRRLTAVGWMPAKGMPSRKRWKHADGVFRPWYLRPIDPFLGTADAGRVEMNLFEFAGDFFLDVLQDLRGRRQPGAAQWSVSKQMDQDDFWRHMDAKVKLAVRNHRTGLVTHEWRLRSQHWPDHLLDCEVTQVAGAAFFKLFDLPKE